MIKNLKIVCVVLLAFIAVVPAQASENWFESLFGPGLDVGDPIINASGNETILGPGGGGGDPGVDPE